MNEDDDLLKKILGIGKSSVNAIKSFAQNVVSSANPITGFKKGRDELNRILDLPTYNPVDAPDVTYRSALGTFAKTAPQEFGNFIRKGVMDLTPKVVQPIVKPVANLIANTSQAVGSGVRDVATGAYNLMTKPLTVSNIIKNTASGVYGIGKVAAAGTPVFQVANAATQLPSKSSVIPRLSAGFLRGQTGEQGLAGDVTSKPINIDIGDWHVAFDPVEGVGQMVGFIKNPINQKIFGNTEKIALPITNKVANFLATNGVRGGIENFLMDLKNLPDEASPEEKVKFLLKTTALGAGMEIGGRTITEAIPQGLMSRIPALATLVDELKASIRGRVAPAVAEIPGQPRTSGGQYDFMPKKEPIYYGDLANMEPKPRRVVGDVNPEDMKTGDTIRFDQRFGNKFTPAGGKTAMGAFAGVEIYQDDQGNYKVRFNPERAALGIGAAAFLSTKGHLSDIENIINSSKSQDQMIEGVSSALDYKIGNILERVPKEGTDAIKDMQGLRAAVNKTMYELAGVDPKAGKNQAYFFEQMKTNPEISGIISTLEDYVGRIDEVIKNGAKTLEDTKAGIINRGTNEPVNIDELFGRPKTELAVRQPNEVVPKTADEIIANTQRGIEQPQTPQIAKTEVQGEGQLPPGGQPPQGGNTGNVQGSTWLDGITNKFHNLYTRAVDRLHPLTEAAKLTGDEQDLKNMQWAIAGHYGAGSTANYHIDYELAPILKSVDDVNALRDAAIAMRDIELTSRGIKGSPEQTAAIQTLEDLKTKYGAEKMQEYGDTLKKLYQYQSDMVKKYLVDTGIMSQKAYTEMTSKNQFYVPFKRVMDKVDEFLGVTPQSKGVGSVSGQNVIFGIKGSDKEIQDPLESIVENTYKLVGLGKRQEVAQTIVGLKDKLPDGMIREVQGRVGNKDVIALFENGKVKHYEAPLEVVEAAKGLREEALNNIVRWLSVPTQWFRATATAMNPEFAIPNTFRDLQTAFVNIGLNPFGFVRGLAHLINKDEVYQEFLKSGAQTSRISIDRPFLKQTVEGITDKGVNIKSVSDIGNLLQTMGEFSEQPTRIAVWEKAFNDAVAKGLDEESAFKEAAMRAQETTTNFARRGSDTQSLNALYAFVNARLQGTDQLLRSFKQDPGGVAMRLGIMTLAPAVALYTYNNRFESYNDERVVTPADKRDNFIFMLSDKPIEALGGAQFIKVPKGDVGRLANPVEAFLDYTFGKGGDVLDSTLQVLSGFSPIDVDTPSQAAGSIVPTALKPFVEVGLNKNFYQGNQLVPDYKKNYPAGFQDNSYTSPFFRMVGQKLGVSPAKLQNIAEGLGTGWTRIAEMLLNKITPQEYYTERNQQGAPINTTPVVRRFLGGERRSEEEQLQVEKSRAESMQREISTIRNAIKKGDIPYEEGMRQIEKLQKGSGKIQGVSTASGDVQRYIQLYELDKYTQPSDKTGIGKYEHEKDKLSEARKLFAGSSTYEKIPEADRMAILEQGFGLDPKDVEYDVYSNADTDVKVNLIQDQADSEGWDHKTLIQNLIMGRKDSLSGKKYVTDTVLDNLYKEGMLTDAERKYLKRISQKDGKLKVSGTGGSSGNKTAINNLIKAMKMPEIASVQDVIKNTQAKVPYRTRSKVAIDTNLAKIQVPESITGGSSLGNIEDLIAKTKKSPKTGVSAEAYKLVRGGGGSVASTPTKLSKSFYRPA